ncbi:MAG: prepilin-type N-terminal cleavage/methylation domain-containing protein [Sulfurimicrobium sp.]|nr:prepilin-type N-terminal cleavage/methylation domain-containing protein [Sulfurimicrobium sp.]MDO9189556.1 prepilin-type N-terminal cleavage/methylation domain-containing protein [Sulfurimicrobium sp.]MDP1704432.1 prepilin-type N-terminal cleavage/methylation domain-containing protein [Sulfurimicrobium sp.]
MHKHEGFSLVELAIVLVVVALLLGGLLVPLTMQIEQQKIRETNKTMEEIKEALIGYALSHSSTPNNRPYLPCPDVTAAVSGQGGMVPNDGLEDRCPDVNGACAAVGGPGYCPVAEGNVPWSTLGVADGDGWGNRMRYRVHPKFSFSGVASATTDGFQLATSLASPTIRVCTGNACVSTLATAVPVVILSHGKNGLGAINLAGNVNPQPIAEALDEAQNANSMSGSPNRNFTSRTITGAQSPCSDSAPGPTMPLCEFDDLVTWLSPNILFNRMVAAGRLP